MTGLLSVVLTHIEQSCITNKCNKDRCGVSLRKSPLSRLIIDCDKRGSPFGPSQSKCDYLIFEEAQNGTGRAITIELKSGRIKAQDAIGQLQAGAAMVERLIAANVAVDLLPLLAYGNIPKGERVAIKSGRVRFRGKAIGIKRIRCGDPLP